LVISLIALVIQGKAAQSDQAGSVRLEFAAGREFGREVFLNPRGSGRSGDS
jgi:hypothetical protein